MNIGAAMAFGSTSVPEIADWSRRAEDAGVDSVWLGEAWRELAVPLTAVSLATERVRIAAGVQQIFPANPIITALAAAQLQETSRGRFALGLGLGAPFVVERWFGVPYERPLQRMREFVAVVRGALASRHGEPFSYTGEIFTIGRYRMRFAAEQPDVPILIAAVGPRMLELAGEVADGVILGAIHSSAYIEDVRRHLAIGAERAGRDPATIQIHAFVICAADADRDRSLGLARASIAYSAQYPHYRRRLEEEGFGPEAARIAAHVAAHEQEAALALVGEAMLERFTIAGTAEECRAQSVRFAAQVDEIVLTLVPFRIDEQEAASRLLIAAAALAGSRATVQQ
jgi:alkanesulfonate monooxygenase SsuD/methylene tetrahydromethanopterin reductase-like flavin-dependent oxidoreductase (luciferase family)